MKSTIRSIRGTYWLMLMFASTVWVSACTPDGQNEGGARRSAGPVTFQANGPDDPPARWAGLIGEYGPDDDIWIVLEDESRLHLRSGEVAYPLEEASADGFLGRPPGADEAERLLFTRRGDGRAAGFQLGEAYFTRREVGTVGGETFRIDPVRDVEELRLKALAVSLPVEEGVF